jgi:histidinol phosphate phosphatase HisJ family
VHINIYDTHTHSKYSFDGCMEIDEMCRIAIERDIKMITVTDHYDIDGIVYGYYPPYYADDAYNDIMTAKDTYSGKLHIGYGIELGQAHVMPEAAAEFLNKYKFEYVIGSFHNMRDVPDFSFMRFNVMPIEYCGYLWQRYLDEFHEMLDFDGIHTVAHLTYPVRYMMRANKKIEYKKYYDNIISIYKKIIEKGLCLEINTSGLRQDMKVTMPDVELLKLYYDCGGELISIGSDAHKPEHIGMNITDAYDIARDIGFKYTTVYINGKPEFIKL